MTADSKQTLKSVGGLSAVIIALTLGGIVYAALSIRLEWDNAPGAVITVIEVTTNNVDWYHVATVTNAQSFALFATGEKRFFRVSHPQIVGHYWDTGAWRVNRELLGIPGLAVGTNSDRAKPNPSADPGQTKMSARPARPQ